MLRRIYEPINDIGNWKTRYYYELYNIYEELDLSDYLQLMRLKWACHKERIPNYRIPKKVLKDQPGGKKPVGQPLDSRDLMKVGNWRRAAESRQRWKGSIDEAKASLKLSRR